jgi:outer membrane protein OmpA-like peptidoglycan-associated protein
VSKYLVEHGIEEGRIVTRGAGPDEPIDSNATREGRASNRRIEFRVLE